MAIQISGTTVINDSRELENVQISELALFGTGLDTDNPGTTINYTNPTESTTNANTGGGGLYIRDSTFTWYSRLNQNASWSSAVTLVCAKLPTGGSSVETQLNTVQDGDTLLVYINSSNYAIYEVNDTSIFSSGYARFFDVDFVSGAGNFAVATNGALQLQFGFAKITTTLTKTTPTAARTITLPNASGTVALTSDVGGIISRVAAVADGTGGTPTFDNSEGCSSLTDFGVGRYGYNLSNNMSNTNYFACGVASYGGTTYGRDIAGEYAGGNIDNARTTGQCRVGCYPENFGDGLTGLFIAGDQA